MSNTITGWEFEVVMCVDVHHTNVSALESVIDLSQWACLDCNDDWVYSQL